MSLTIEKLKKEIGKYKNTLVIGDLMDIVRLVGVIEETDDFYWLYDKGKYNKVEISYSSCVGGWIPLKGFVPKKDYDRMVSIWNLNTPVEAL